MDEPISFDNLSPSTTELLSWHHRLNHMNFNTIQVLAKAGFLPPHLATCSQLLCSACQLGKQKRLPRNKTGNPIYDPDNIQPGNLVSTDQVESSTPGRPLTYSGYNSNHKINTVTIYVDSCSKKIFNHFQTSTCAEETIAGKLSMERQAQKYNVKIKKIRADSGIFKCKKFRDHINSLEQDIIFCGVSAHHQNGIAERHIQTLVNITRTTLLNSHARWPAVIDMELWTFVFQHTVDQWNSTLKKELNYLTPDEVLLV